MKKRAARGVLVTQKHPSYNEATSGIPIRKILKFLDFGDKLQAALCNK